MMSYPLSSKPYNTKFPTQGTTWYFLHFSYKNSRPNSMVKAKMYWLKSFLTALMSLRLSSTLLSTISSLRKPHSWKASIWEKNLIYTLRERTILTKKTSCLAPKSKHHWPILKPNKSSEPSSMKIAKTCVPQNPGSKLSNLTSSPPSSTTNPTLPQNSSKPTNNNSTSKLSEPT